MLLPRKREALGCTQLRHFFGVHLEVFVLRTWSNRYNYAPHQRGVQSVCVFVGLLFMKRINFNVGGWSYEAEQDPKTGEMRVLRHGKMGTLEKIVEYAKAEASGLVEDVPLPVVEARKAACFGCDSLEVDGENWYCKSCGCPKWERSRLQVKWEMPKATCPYQKWPE